MSGPTGAGSRTRRRFGVLVAGPVLAIVLLSGCSASPAHPVAADSYGPLPTWLPEDTSRPNSLLVADRENPAVTSEGDEVEVHVDGVAVRVQVVGPEVPGEGLPAQPEDTTCTWTVTMSRASAPVHVGAAEFDALDHLGTVYRVAAVPSKPVPSSLQPGSSVTFALRAAMPTGEGVMRFSGGTDSVLASWDFVVEND